MCVGCVEPCAAGLAQWCVVWGWPWPWHSCRRSSPSGSRQLLLVLRVSAPIKCLCWRGVGVKVLVLRISWSIAVCGCDTFSEEAAPGNRANLGATYICSSTHLKGPNLVR